MINAILDAAQTDRRISAAMIAAGVAVTVFEWWRQKRKDKKK